MRKTVLYIIVILLGLSCKKPIPKDYVSVNGNIDIYPDYTNLTVPYNIAPLNFFIDRDADHYLTRFSSNSAGTFIIEGKSVFVKEKVWKNLLNKTKGDTLHIDVFLLNKGEWSKYSTIKHYIAPDPIDDYIAYRLIEPGYDIYDEISIQQRQISSFEEKTIYNSRLVSTDSKGQCINCHSFQDYNRTGKMQMHFREGYSGTLVSKDDKLIKVNLKTDSTISGGVYPSWHPSLDLVVYSVNKINQTFHTKDVQKVEVRDKKSGIIMYDIEANEVSKVIDRPNAMETFPYWSPDGKTLFFASSDYRPELDNVAKDLSLNYNKIKYNLYKVPFDIQTRKFGKIDTVFNATVLNKSAVFPRLSPKGRYLLFSMGNYGNFHIWHKSSDLYLKDMETGEVRNLEEINSNETESYHSWSSNGRWIIFSSRRENGGYTRFYLSNFDGKGKFSKAFILPQESPDFYPQFFKSFNIPEFLVKPVDFSPHDLVKAIKKGTKQANYSEN